MRFKHTGRRGMAPHGEPSPWYEQRGCSVRPNCADPPAEPAFSTGKKPLPKAQRLRKAHRHRSKLGRASRWAAPPYIQAFSGFQMGLASQIAEVELGATMRPEFDSGPNQTDVDLSL